ncbi:MAG: acyl-CoA dehydratase activase-related protein [Deltaproteobacteria bacterium]|nr:acyl-CoA dehydratase activase-related protein [Deltaproteobacteria bacterium]
MRYKADPPRRKVLPATGKVGVPRSLAYDELRAFFDRVLFLHGIGTVVSPPTSTRTLEAGLKTCIDEVCLPLKVFFGHVAALVDAGLETILVPRICSVAKGRNLCPKFHVLPDLAERAFPDTRIVAPYIDLHHSRRRDLDMHLVDACRPMLQELGVWNKRSKALVMEACDTEPEGAAEAPDGPGALDVAVLGHFYAERDPFLGLGVRRVLEKLGARVGATPEPWPEAPSSLEEGMYYESNVRTARAIEHHLARGADGIVLITYFACGPDSYGAETLLYRLAARGSDVPVLRLIIDEHTSAEGLATRLATFVEVARHRKASR